MKTAIFLISFAFLFLVCTAKKDVLTSVPVLIDYKLYYPDEALERGLEGKVMLSMIVTEEGKAENVRVHTSSGNALLDSAAVKTAKTFVFSPARLTDRPSRSSVLMPVEFRLTDMNMETWITEVKILQKRIERYHDKEAMKELYGLYKRLIFSTRFKATLDVNDYIIEAVHDSTRELWQGYWSRYPASSILFIDIMRRYPDSFVSLMARADFNKFLKEEAIRMRHVMQSPASDTLISRLHNAVKTSVDKPASQK